MADYKKRYMKSFIGLMLCALLLSACGKDESDSKAAASGTDGKVSAKVTTVLNWFPQSEHGGLFTALEEGIYKEAGLDMTLQPGGPQISATQIVASGKAEFGMGQADEILLARQNGIPVVAVFAIFQKSPQGLMVHGDANVDSMEGLRGKTVYVAGGAAYWEYLKKAYKLEDTTQMAYTGSMAPFLADKNVAQQGYVTSEPFEMKQQNVDVDFLLNADFGYEPYGNVLYTTEDYLENNPEVVKAYVEATAEGFESFKVNYEKIIPAIHKANPDMSVEKLTFAAETMIPLVFEGDAEKNGVGYMSKERWENLAKQMKDIGMLKSMPDVTKAYTDKFLTE